MAGLAKNLTLAQELGAEVITTQDPDIAQGVQRVAEQKGVTQIILEKSPKRTLKNFFRRSLANKLSKENSDIDIHIVRQPSFFSHKKKIRKKNPATWLLRQLDILFLTFALIISNTFIIQLFGYKEIGFVFLLLVMGVGLFFKRGLTVLASVSLALLWDFLFIPSIGIFYISTTKDIGFLSAFLLVAILTGVLINRIRERQELSVKRERSTQAIYEIVREIAIAPTSEQIFKAIQERVGAVLNGVCAIAIKKLDNGLMMGKESSIIQNGKEKAVAHWVIEHGQAAGWSTSTLPSVKNLYIPLKGFKEVVGVLAFRPLVDKPLLPEQTNFLYTVAQLLANYLERSLSEARERKSKYRQQIEKIYEKVLQTFSDELLRPLRIIQEAIVECREERKATSSIDKIEKSSEGLFHIAESAMTMAKLSSGLMTYEKSAHDIHKLIEVCCAKSEKNLKQHQLKLNLAKDLPRVLFDFSLMEILLGNLLSNAIEYSPPGSTIEIEAIGAADIIIVSVADEGKGIPEDLMELVFEKFYRVPGTTSTGLGLGLPIAKAIAEIHGGTIRAENRASGGALFTLLFPIK